MLFDDFLGRLISVVAGRRGGGLSTSATGLAPRAGSRLAATEGGKEVLWRAARERTLARLIQLGASWDEATDYLGKLPSFAGSGAYPSPFADFAVSSPSRADGHSYARTQAAGARLDALNASFTVARATGHVEAGRAAIEEAGLAHPEWFVDFAEYRANCSNPAAWLAFQSARSWEEMAKPLRIFTVRTLLDWLACWDVDFCLSYFEGYEPRSIFALVAPRPSSRINHEWEPGKARRGLFETPNKRLLDVCSVLIHKIRHGRWPASTPKLDELAAWTAEASGWLAKVGSGERPLQYRTFERLWDRGVSSGTVAQEGCTLAPPPFPLYVAAQVFELMLVQRRGGARGPAETIVTLGDEFYQRPWVNRLAAAQGSEAPIGSGPWPAVLA